MGEFERRLVQISIEDVIRILEDSPARNHFLLPHVTIVEVMNRVSIAHLSIEKAIKYLIRRVGGDFEKEHNLEYHFRELKSYDQESANFLEKAFASAVRFYGLHSAAKGMNYLGELENYLKTTGSIKRFNDIRYWELDDPYFERVELHQVELSIHMELLLGLHEILIEPDRPRETVESRVERAVETAITAISYRQGTMNWETLSFISEWAKECGSFGKALCAAVRCDFALENQLAADFFRVAYKTLLEAKDPAVRFFASTLDVLPRQPRDVVPKVEWLDPKEQRKGRVITAAGDTLGFIERGPHRLWYITPIQSGPVGYAAKAQKQLDAMCYLAQLLARTAQVTVDGKASTLRVVGEERHLFKPAPVQSSKLEREHDETKMYTASFWDENQGMEKGQEIRIEAQRHDSGRLIFSDALSGHVQEVQGHQVSVLGRSFTVIGSP